MSRFVAIDFETANPARDSACSIGLVRVEDGRMVDRAVYYIRPPSREFWFTHIHGLRWEDVAASPDFGGLWPTLCPWFDGIDFAAAHNARFDIGVLRACCTAYNLVAPPMPFVCTVEIARTVWNVRPTDLKSVARFLCVKLNHHEALSDATACAEIVIAAELDGWRPPTPAIPLSAGATS